MKILLDMNFSPSWIPLLTEAGFDAVHWIKLGAVDAMDTELFDWARINKAIIFTHDLDFGTLLALTNAESPSVFQIRTYDVTPNSLGLRAIGLLRRFERELSEGALIVADELRERVRLLPLSR
jgi:predicted nuclease of predicted toxin-antitoxin system